MLKYSFFFNQEMLNCVDYVAFLQGINVGGHALVKMQDLQKLFLSLGFTNIKTILASGNVVFEATENAEVIAKKIEQALQKLMNKEIIVIIRTLAELQELVKKEPFKKTSPTAKKYATFLAKPVKKIRSSYFSEQEGFELLEINEYNVFSIAFPLANGRSGDPGSYVEKNYGVCTTRNWNTIERIVKERRRYSNSTLF